MALGVIKEWCCALHGEFEASHAICPADGCASTAVVREFRTAVTVGRDSTRRFDAGIRRSANMYHQSDWKSARAGEMSKVTTGGGVLWGDESRKVLGRSFGELTAIAQKPLVVPKRDGSGNLTLTRNNAMREAATEAGITRRRVAKPGELTVAHADRERSAKAAESITA